MNFFNQAMNLISSGAIAGGAIWSLFGGFTLAAGLREQSGQQIQSGMWQLIGGAIIVALGGLLKLVELGF